MAVNLGQVSSSGHLELVNLGNTYTQEMKNDISSGAFKICKTGCYLTINGTKYIFAHPDYWLNKGGPNNICTTHHMAVITAGSAGTSKMANASNTPYHDTYLRQHVFDAYAPQIRTDFGTDHILKISDGLVTSVSSSGNPSNWGYYLTTVKIPTQPMLFGALFCTYFTSSNYAYYNIGVNNDQFELFAKRPDLIPIAGVKYWLRDIYNSSNYVVVTENGTIAYDTYSNANGIRFVFALC